MVAVNPNPGEAIDRQVICLVKADMASKQAPNIPDNPMEKVEMKLGDKVMEAEVMKRIPGQFKPVLRLDPHQWVLEANVIQTYLEQNWFPFIARNERELAPKLEGKTKELEKLHTRLYTLNTEIRRKKEASQHSGEVVIAREIQQLAFQLVDLNDARAQIVADINQLFGCPVVEKQYAAFQ